MLRRAREVIFWPGLTGDIKQLAASCDVCAEFKPRQQKEPLIEHNRGDRPWVKIGIDLFECDNKTYLVTVDYYSGWFECDVMSSTMSSSIICKLKPHFARYGIPQVIMSDNGRQFVSAEFERFCREWGIEHVTSSPYHSRSNGMAESAVKAAKRLIMKTNRDSTDLCDALLELRNTPRQGSGLSPAQAMFGRRTRSNVPCTNFRTPADAAQQLTADRRARQVAEHHDRRARALPPLQPGARVRVPPSPSTGPTWTEAVVTARRHDDVRSYDVRPADDQVTLRRNRVHLRDVTAPAVSPADADRQCADTCRDPPSSADICGAPLAPPGPDAVIAPMPVPRRSVRLAIKTRGDVNDL